MKKKLLSFPAAAIALYVLAFPGTALAVPSFARQTGYPCQVCHTTPPELTSFGRTFKLNGYTLTGLQQIEAKHDGHATLRISEIPPLSAMLQISATQTRKGQPGTQNGSVEFPQQLSLFFAGEISPRLGSFMQMTYDNQVQHFTLDNTDIRYANQAQPGGTNLIYGLTLNNSPGVEDLWNSTSVWGFPWAAPDAAPAPAAGPILDGALAQNVAGLGGYAMLNQQWYGTLTLYRSSTGGGAQPQPKPGTIQGVAPYWRLAWQRQMGAHYLEVGTFGMLAKFAQGLAGTGTTGLDDKYADYGVDAQYEHPLGDDLLSVHANYVRERQTLDASAAAGVSANSANTLNRLRLDGVYHVGRHYTGSLGAFRVTGSADTGLYAPGAISGSANGKPDSNGWIGQLTYLPWQNTQFILQYTAYSKFNGGSNNYDGSGRNASDNNTVYLLGWFVW